MPDIPNVGRLREFHETFGGITFYANDVTEEAASRIASPHQWAELDSDFRDWFDHLDENERAEALPLWIDACLVIGEQPRSYTKRALGLNPQEVADLAQYLRSL